MVGANPMQWPEQSAMTARRRVQVPVNEDRRNTGVLQDDSAFPRYLECGCCADSGRQASSADGSSVAPFQDTNRREQTGARWCLEALKVAPNRISGAQISKRCSLDEGGKAGAVGGDRRAC